MTSKVRNILLTIYVLVILGISATARADVNIFPVFDNGNAEMMVYSGEVALDVEGRTYLITADEHVFELASVEDLSSYNGAQVEVEGFILRHKVGPVLELMSRDPLSMDEQNHKVAPVLIVNDISKVTE